MYVFWVLSLDVRKGDCTWNKFFYRNQTHILSHGGFADILTILKKWIRNGRMTFQSNF
ncbi:unnamed protein product [Ixodes persulcatus]